MSAPQFDGNTGANFLNKARTYRQSDDFLKNLFGTGTNFKRRIFHDSLYAVYHEIVIHGQTQAHFMKRFSRAEKLAGEAPVKLLMPVVLFIFPAVFLLLLGPVILQAMKMMR